MIPVKNIYYMLSYAFRVLHQKEYKKLETEEFQNAEDMFAAILIAGTEYQVKRGMRREYLPETDTLTAVRGKINLQESIRTQSIYQKRLVCTYDTFSENAYMNRILKTTLQMLYHTDIAQSRKKKIRKLLEYFRQVDLLEPKQINWRLNFDRSNQTYRMLMGICELTIKGLLQTQITGSQKLMDFMDDQQMSALYEHFILGYYQKHRDKWGIQAAAKYVDWQLDDGTSELLPRMLTDIMLTRGKQVLILDAKYYDSPMQEYAGHKTVRSNHLYQIFSYVKNKEYELRDQPGHSVAGMLLYAETDTHETPEILTYSMSGNQISVGTLNLNQEFSEIAATLDGIADHYFERQQ